MFIIQNSILTEIYKIQEEKVYCSLIFIPEITTLKNLVYFFQEIFPMYTLAYY